MASKSIKITNNWKWEKLCSNNSLDRFSKTYSKSFKTLAK